ncbi:hypothetical protein V490_06002 [Pseudogymnoascus sp. VKM F-3557]|nr:hypothetical protein V490_06002 [Pseudogymnoascus sp. VKM F-3557]
MSSDKEVAGQGARRELAGQNEREGQGGHGHQRTTIRVSDGNGGDVTGVAIAMIILPPSEPAELPVTLPEYQSCCATANRTRQAATAQLVASGSCTPRHLPRPITHADIADDADLQSQARNQHYRGRVHEVHYYEYTRFAPFLAAAPRCQRASACPPAPNALWIPRLARGAELLAACCGGATAQLARAGPSKGRCRAYCRQKARKRRNGERRCNDAAKTHWR